MTTYQSIIESTQIDDAAFRREAKEHAVFTGKKDEAWVYISEQDFIPESVSILSGANNELAQYFQENPSELVLGRKENPFSYANTALFSKSKLIELTGESAEIQSITLGEATHQRLHIVATKGSKSSLLIRVNSVDSFLNTVTTIIVNEEAELDITVISDVISAAYIDHIDIKQHGNSTFQIAFFDRNPNKTKRHLFHVFEGEQAKAGFFGAALLAGTSQLSTQLWITHGAKECESEQRFKSIVTDKAFVEFSGLVSVEEGCHLTDSKQLNQSLLLSDHARVVSRPQLRIDADDVQCAHGSTIGQLNPEEVFYCQTRGLSEMEAKSLLTKAFIEDVFDAIPHADIRRQLEETLRKEVLTYVV